MPDTPPTSAPVPLSTPPSNGAGSNAAHKIKPTQDAYKPYLQVDITPSPAILFDQFLSLIFTPQQGNEFPELNDIRTRIKNNAKFKKLLKTYAEKKATREADRYEPFNLLVNHIISLLVSSSQDSILIRRNDPARILGSDSVRKPDCVVVHQRPRGPTDKLHWSELLAFVEFKLVNHVAQPEPEELKQPVLQPGSVQEKYNSGPSNSGPSNSVPSNSGTTRVLRSTTKAAATPSASSNTHSGLLSTSNNPVSNRKSASSSKRSGEHSETLSNKRHKGDAEDTELSEVLPPKNHLIQCASYALEMLSRGGLLTHVLGALVTDGQLELLYYDRSLSIRSQPKNFITDPSCLIDFVYCMHHASMKQWGRLDKIQLSRPLSPAPSKKSLYGAFLTLKKGKLVLKLLDIVFVQHALIGRGTCVVQAEVFKGDAKAKKWGSKPFVVKFSFTPGTRISEGDLLDDITNCAKGKKNKNKSILDHLPCVLHHEAFAPGETDVQHRLAKYFKARNKANKDNVAMQVDYEERTLQVLVMKELHPIRDLDTADKLIPVVQDIFKCYKWLHETAEVIHRDISENNLMYWKKADGTICGVLSDYDLSVKLDREYDGPSSKQRTGTRPFMARDLLEPTPREHLYRHDLESLFYVIIVLMFRSPGEQLTEDERFKHFPALKQWFTQGPADLLDKKKAFYSTELPQAPHNFRKLRQPMSKMKRMFRDGYETRLDMLEDNPAKQPLFDESTLDGHVNFDKFQAILDSV
ncbi:hypothetical protein BJ912DRAFT_1139962 [Pholiota molesta]|nr:hypothetical protein BJ912DRAFT_1139962 [Pholiota molesta]